MKLELRAGEHSRVDVFSIDLPPPQAQAFGEAADKVAIALGARPDPTQTDLFDTAVMGDLGLVGYLRDGIGISADQLNAHAAALGNIDQALILRRGAFEDQAVTLTIGEPLRHVATLQETQARVDLTPLRSPSASGHLPGPEADGAATPRLPRWVWVTFVGIAILLAAIPFVVGF